MLSASTEAAEDRITELELIQRIVAGDKDAYADLVRKHHSRIIAVCIQILSDPTQAQDAAQDVFVHAYTRLKSFRGDSSFSTWLYRLATNTCLDLLRKRKRQRAESFDELVEKNKAVLTSLLLPSSNIELTAEKKDLLRRVLSCLSENERTVLILREAQGLSYREIASVFNCSLDAVKARLKRARRALREKTRHLFDLENV